MLILLFVLLAAGRVAGAQAATDLWLRGYSVIPTPKNVRLAEGDIQVDSEWALDDSRVGERSIAVRSLIGDLKSFHALTLRQSSNNGKIIQLAVTPGSVATGAVPEIDRQAYRLRIDDWGIEIIGNGEPGLFYGVQTLVQLVKRGADGRLQLPRGTIEDWPALQLRFLHWDVNQHQDRMETLKRYLDWTSRFKANMIALQFEDKFDFPSRPFIGAPGAYTTEQYQELVNYGLARHIQIVPLIQAPAHFSWALKHPELAELRDDGNNYEANLCDPGTYDLIFSLYDDVIKASRGVDYFFASTDEVYYAGIDPRCGKPYNPVNRSLLWVEFAERAHDFLAKRVRKMLLWVMYPLLPEHVKLLPTDVIDAEAQSPNYIETDNQVGIRQLAYASMRGEELLFPDYLNVFLRSFPAAPGVVGGVAWLPRPSTVGGEKSRIELAYEKISFPERWHGHPIGVLGAAWDASGGHNETFWLGWSTVAQYGWNPGTTPVDQHISEFMDIYYGPRAVGMTDIYQSMQSQARAWERTWDVVPSTERGPVYGNARAKGLGTQLYDTTLSPPPLPQMPDLKVQPFIAEKYGQFLVEARRRIPENDRLVLALQSNLARVDRNQYNLEVLLSLAKLTGHHWRLLSGLAETERSLVAAGQAQDAERAVRSLVTAYGIIDRLRKEHNEIFRVLVSVWEKSCYPRGRAVGGKTFLNIQDDSKDYFAARRPDWTYLIASEQRMGLDKWQRTLLGVIRSYAGQHKVPVTGLDLQSEE